MSRSYDLVVIGAGVAGGVVARLCADARLTVAILESGEFGGTCPLRGCNPKKVLLSAAEALERVRSLHGKGVAGSPEIRWPELMDFKRGFVDPLPERIERSYERMGIDTIHGQGEFTGPSTVDVAGQTLIASNIMLAPGSMPRHLNVPGENLLTTSDAFMELDQLPRRIVFVGGGYISFEFAHLAARAGAECTIIHRSEQPLKGYEPELADKLLEATRELGVDVRLGLPLASVEQDADALLIRAGNEARTVIQADMAVHGAGRVPALDALNLDKANIHWSPDTGIEVNEFMQTTTNPAVYAGGDAARTPYALTPAAHHEGKVAAHNILNGNSLTVNQEGIPRVVFTIPPLAAIGLGQAQAEEQGLEFEVRQGDMARWLPWERLGERHAAYKVLTTPQGRILGAHLLGNHAEEMANTLGMAMRLGLTVERIQETIWTYPSSGYYLQYILPPK